MNIGIIGVGLMGGSIGKTAIKRDLATVYGTDNKEVLQKAFLTNALNYELTDENIALIDILFVCVYPRQIPDVLKKYVPKLKKGAIVCDIGGNKRSIVECMEILNKEYPDINFIASHPMAGREFTGVSHSITTLYEKSSFILIPVNASLDSISTLKDFVTNLGATDIIYTNAINHDKMIAYTSQLCHIVSSAFVKNEKAKLYFGYSAGSFKDLTRVAKLNPIMWGENMIDNRENLVEDIDILILELQKYKNALQNNDITELQMLLSQGTQIKESLKDKTK